MLRHDAETRALLRTPRFEIGSHGAEHIHLPGLEGPAQRGEIEGAVSLLRSHFRVEAWLFRPPYGEYDGTTEKVLSELGALPDLLLRGSAEILLRKSRGPARDGSASGAARALGGER